MAAGRDVTPWCPLRITDGDNLLWTEHGELKMEVIADPAKDSGRTFLVTRFTAKVHCWDAREGRAHVSVNMHAHCGPCKT